ncbi:TlpA family protein disulfide reductase [Nocardioides sp. AX2bis]|uniref:TlpA family protein disulfide reductase n=1 Tax=Nocardioides sp. AX2bis TaxID=2653157 RepID=UPI0012EF8110|nr:TlpA disulfide reductase family protein [Nocardioides sp. AX2bis]VXC27228.1 conserved exported hypothetical protein [Nocardioides sp. AX2bis]
MRRRTTRVAAALSAAGAVVALAGGCTSATTEDEVETLPEVTLQTFDAPGRQAGEQQGEVYLPDVEGPAVVNLFASWCGPCREELPLVEQFAQDHGDQVRVLGIDYLDPQTEKARTLAEDSGLTFQLLQDPDGELDGASPFPTLQGLPFWAFVDADGRVVHREFVIIESEQQLVDLAEEHLGVRL